MLTSIVRLIIFCEPDNFIILLLRWEGTRVLNVYVEIGVLQVRIQLYSRNELLFLEYSSICNVYVTVWLSLFIRSSPAFSFLAIRIIQINWWQFIHTFFDICPVFDWQASYFDRSTITNIKAISIETWESRVLGYRVQSWDILKWLKLL